MKDLWRAFSAELLKLKRTLAMWMVLVSPVVVVALYVGMILERSASFVERGDNIWINFAASPQAMWAILMMPLFIALETALVANMEHGQKQWKHLFALPLPRWTVYAAKQILVSGMTFAATLVLWLTIVAAGLLLRSLLPGLGFEGSIPWWELLKPLLLIYLLEILVLAIHSYISLRWHSFALASAVGIVAVAVNLILMNSEKWNKFFPWSLPVHAIEGNFLNNALLISLIGAALVTFMGCWSITRRDVLE